MLLILFALICFLLPSLSSDLHKIGAREDAVLPSGPEREESLPVGDDEIVVKRVEGGPVHVVLVGL